MNLPAPSALAGHWLLDTGVVYVNHGSFGACPRAVLDMQRVWRERLEREPVRFFVDVLEPALDEVRARIGALCGCSPASIAPVPNATTGVATALACAGLREGDEIIATDHEYLACLNNARRAASRTGARVVAAEIPFPIEHQDEVIEAVMSRVTARTRLALISHVTSASALVLPVERLVPMLRERGVETIVDAAHAPGCIPLDIEAIGAAWYAANCHKWLCSPKGAGFVSVREDMRSAFRPLVLSNSAEMPRPDRDAFLTEFDYVGTHDASAFLSVAAAIDTVGGMHSEGWPGVIKANRSLLLHAHQLLCERLEVEPAAPEAMLASMATILLPAHTPDLRAKLTKRSTRNQDALQDALMDRHAIEVPVWQVPRTSTRAVRISAQLYNSIAQYEYLVEALVAELQRERISAQSQDT